MPVFPILEFLAYLFIFVVGLGIAWVVVLYVIDVTQTSQAIRRNYPVVGRFRYLFETMGEFFRQYFFAMDREELPFNRAERSWVYRACKDLSNTVAFGSTRNIRSQGTIFFVNTAFPTLETDAAPVAEVTIGP
ncbi:MAG: FMN-binding glutamate synthase family protein, partial [Gammaproteobacteria bacterium]|nr:FMN-binding glutamate synthase family protein [Gammaproteobacteria bacterium]